MEDGKHNSKRVRSINNIIQGVDLTPEDPKYATFKQYRYYIGTRYDEPSFNKIPRELLDPEVPSPLPKPPSKAPIVVEGVDHTPDDPIYATFYEYRYGHNGVRESNHLEIKKPRPGVGGSMKVTVKQTGEDVEVPCATTFHKVTATHKVGQRIAVKPHHPQYSRLKDMSAEEIIEETRRLRIHDLPPPHLRHVKTEYSSGDPYSSKKYEHSIEITQTSPVSESPPNTKPVASPQAPVPSTNLKMPGTGKKRSKNKKGNCNGSCAVLSQACRVHKAVLDSLEFVSDLLRIIDETFDELSELKAAFEKYNTKHAKELCAACGAMHSRGITKFGFQREHNDLIEAFYQTVSDIRDRMDILLAEIAVEKEAIMTIINAAHTLGNDRGEPEEGEMHKLGESLFDIYEEEICGLDEMETEYKKDRPFLCMDEFRNPRQVKLATDTAKLAESYAALAVTEAELKDLEEKAAQKAKETEAELPRMAASVARKQRQIRTMAENDRLKKWHNESVKMKLRALVEYDNEVTPPPHVRAVERNGMASVSSIRWWMEKGREDNIKDGGNGDLLGGIIRTRKMLESGKLVDWDDTELEVELARL